MNITISPDISSPARIIATGVVDAIDALDIVDFIDLTAPESLQIDVADVPSISASALEVLAPVVRRDRHEGRTITFVGAEPLVDLLLTTVGLVAIDERREAVAA